MEPFNLKKALKGHPVITRGGIDVQELHHFNKCTESHSVIACIDGILYMYSTEGKPSFGKEDVKFEDCDLLMKSIKRKYYMRVTKEISNMDGYYNSDLFESKEECLNRTFGWNKDDVKIVEVEIED